jgi:hypothetical protein
MVQLLLLKEWQMLWHMGPELIKSSLPLQSSVRHLVSLYQHMMLHICYMIFTS